MKKHTPVTGFLPIFLITIILGMTVSSTVSASPTPVMACIGETEDWVYLEEGIDLNQLPFDFVISNPWVATTAQLFSALSQRPVSDEILGQLNELVGDDIWLGYPLVGEEFVYGQHGFNMPADVHSDFTLKGTGDQGQDIEVWFLASDTTPETIYVLPFRTTELFAREDGSYYGIHPCGAYAVPADEVSPIAENILNE